MLRPITTIWVMFMLMMAYPTRSLASSYQVLGVDDDIRQNVLAHVQNLDVDCAALESTISRQHQSFIDQVQKAIQPFGFFNASIKLENLVLPDCKQITIRIDTGPMTTITQSEINIIGSDDEDFALVVAEYDLSVGSPLDQAEYRSLKNKLVQLANEKLYLDARFTEEQITVIQAENQAQINLVFNTGPRYPISQINIDIYKPILSPRMMDRLITIKPHHYTTQSEIFSLRQKLIAYGYFSGVSFEIDEANKNDLGVPLNIQLTAAPKYDYSAGLGFSTDLGPQASFKYNIHRVNDAGHQLTSKIDLSQIVSELALSYKIPSKSRPADKWYNVQMGYQDEKIDNVESQTTKLAVSQTRLHGTRWQNTNFLEVLHESFDTGVEEGDALLLVPGISWTLRQADNISRPDFGYRADLQLKGASEDLLSDASFVQLTLSGKFIHSVGERNRMLYRAKVGGTASSDFDQIPTSYRFFAGGDQTVRGYDFESISPLNNSGDLAGGKHLIVGSVEFEHQFAPQWAVAVFTDVGDAYNDTIDFNHSVGAGLRWFSPIGPIRFDLGVPVTEDENDFRIHLTIGPDL